MSNGHDAVGGMGNDQGVNPPMGSRPRESFLSSPGHPGVVPVVVPVPPASPKPTIPHPATPDWYVPDFFDWIGEAAKSGKTALQLGQERIAWQKSVRLAKSAPMAIGFQLGWEIGDRLFPVGHPVYDWVLGSGGTPDESVGPDGWSHPDWDILNPCGGFGHPCADEGAYKFKMGNTPSYCVPNCNGTIDDGSLFATPGEAFDAAPGILPMGIHRVKTTDPSRNIGVGHASTSKTLGTWDDSGLWSQTFLGEPYAIAISRSRSSEEPMSFPVDWPMEMPYGTRWADAAPAPGQQGEGLGNPLRRALVPVSSTIPLAPLPAVEVVGAPPGFMPPVQVITINPPSAGGGITYHREPPQGRKPPKRKREPPKPSVRSKANVAWVVLNLATEVFDFIDAMFQGLPKHRQKETGLTFDTGRKGTKGMGGDPATKAWAVWKYSDEVDWDAAAMAFVNNQIEDMVVGLIGATSTKANKLSGAATGGGGAVYGRQAKQFEAASDLEIDKLVKAGMISKDDAKELDAMDDLPIPKMMLNEAGDWQLEFPPSLTKYFDYAHDLVSRR